MLYILKNKMMVSNLIFGLRKISNKTEKFKKFNDYL